METIISVYKDGIIGTAAIMVILTMTAYYVQEYHKAAAQRDIRR